jgi:hypothetical protein
MPCAITDGYKQNNCPLPTPGAYQTFYIANFEEVVSWGGSGNLNEYDSITFDPGAGLYKFQVQRDSVIFREEKQEEENGAVNYTQEITFKILDMGIEARNRVDDLNGVDVTVIMRSKADTFHIVGKDNGARMAVNVRSTESADLGHLVTIRAINQPSLAKHFFDTSVNTTLALLETYVVGS